MQTICPACFQQSIALFYQIPSVPVHSVLNVYTAAQAKSFQRGQIDLGFCRECGFVANFSFQEDLLGYSSDCEESQGFSETFNAFARQMADKLVTKYDLHGKSIIEIGCGKGEFLITLCELGMNKGVGFDPAFVPGRLQYDKDTIRFVTDFYSEHYLDYQADFVCCRMTLEHIHNPHAFLTTVRRAIGDQTKTIVFFQVPDTLRILQDCAFEDIYYEHCSYFTAGSLFRLFHRCGFTVVDMERTYADQYLTIEALPVENDVHETGKLRFEDDLEDLEVLVKAFPEKLSEKISNWQKIFDKNNTLNQRVVLWGSGSKGVAFLAAIQSSEIIQYVVDINPFRQGNFMVGTGQEIVAPEFLKQYKPHTIIIMNPVYKKEIANNLKDLGVEAKLLTL